MYSCLEHRNTKELYSESLVFQMTFFCSFQTSRNIEDIIGLAYVVWHVTGITLAHEPCQIAARHSAEVQEVCTVKETNQQKVTARLIAEERKINGRTKNRRFRQARLHHWRNLQTVNDVMLLGHL